MSCGFYLLCVFSGLTVKLQNKFKVLQNYVIRYLLKAPPHTQIGREEFKKAGLLPFHLRVEQLKLNHMFNIVNGQAPKYSGSNFTMVHLQHCHNTRASIRSCIVPRVNYAGKDSFFYSGIMAWNRLPIGTQLLASRGTFKRRVKQIWWNKVDMCWLLFLSFCSCVFLCICLMLCPQPPVWVWVCSLSSCVTGAKNHAGNKFSTFACHPLDLLYFYCLNP